MIRYQITPSNPAAHLFEVHVEVDKPMPEGQAFSFPAWIPGSYMIRDFARHVVEFSAFHDGEPWPWTKLDKQTWQLAPAQGPVTIRLLAYAKDLSVRGAYLDNMRGYFNGPCVLPAANGHEDQPCTLTILQGQSVSWQLATGMRRLSGDDFGFGEFAAENYIDLIDYPVEMGRFSHASFTACSIPHQIIISGRHQANMTRLCTDLEKICRYQIQLFGEPAPMDSYTFMTFVTADGYGGLEHGNSTSLMCARKDLPLPTDAPDQVRDSYRTYLGLCSHEYFHSWNIKRIRPDVFSPADLSREVHTELLWAFEGITSYYDDLTLVRTNLISCQSYLELLGQTITRVYQGKGQLRQTLTESSFDAWTRFYKQDENAPNAIVSYYAKGALAALALDLKLRDQSQGKCTLDDLMRLLWSRHGKTGVGVPERGIQSLAEELLGESLEDFFELILYRTDPLPLETLLQPLGVELNWRAAEHHADRGGKAACGPALPWLGIRIGEDPLGVRVQMADEDGPAVAAGLSAGDVIIALDELRVTATMWNDVLSRYRPGDRLNVHAFRRDELIRVQVLLAEAPTRVAWLSVADTGLTGPGRDWLHVRR